MCSNYINMKLTSNDMRDILSNFPSIELSYAKVIHKKVYSDYYTIIPKGKKYFAWFTYYKGNECCIFLEIDSKKKGISNIKLAPVSFENELSYGTILYGTLLDVGIFVTENIMYYKGKNINLYNNKKKLLLLKFIFENELNKIAFTKKDIIITLPVMKSNYFDALTEIELLPYSVYSIELNNLNLYGPKFKIIYNKQPDHFGFFEIKANLNDDIYDMFCVKDNQIIFYDNLLIPSYKSSVFMNNLFRNIKENRNLDLLEESDDEEDFNNIDENKYVNLDKKLQMQCKYNFKFNKWEPIKVSNNRVLTNYREVANFQKNVNNNY